MGYSYVFGPVLSGRLGRSLGLDLLGARVCSMNCVYCEVGQVTHLTQKRAAYVSARDILSELARFEAGRQEKGEPLPDVVTLGGSGEPTLNTELPAIVAGVRRILPGVPVAVLTNASTFADPAVRRELLGADMVLPSLDSLVPGEFAAVNRPCPGLGPELVAQGILDFRQEFSGRIFLEVLLVRGMNDTPENLERLAAYCAKLRPHRVDVVTLSRPGTSPTAQGADPEVLRRFRERLCALAEREEKGQEKEAAATAGRSAAVQEAGADPLEAAGRVQASLSRRPQTPPQLAEALSLPLAAVREALERGLALGLYVQAPLGGAPVSGGPGVSDEAYYKLSARAKRGGRD